MKPFLKNPLPKQTTWMVLILLSAALFWLSDHSPVPTVFQIAGIGTGFMVVCNAFHRPLLPTGCKIFLAALIAFLYWILNPVAGVFVIGSLYLGAYYLSRFTGNRRAIEVRQLLGIGLGIALTLVATPTTVSRVVIHFLDMPVAAKIFIHSDPEARRSHSVSKSFPDPSLEPVRVALNTNNVTLDEPMPWIQMVPRRDTEMTLHLVHYNFLHVTINKLRSAELHQIALSEKSDEVTLRKVKHGILITDIAGAESAWLKLPDIQPDSVDALTQLKVLATKLFVWLLVCVAFWQWSPIPDRKKSL